MTLDMLITERQSEILDAIIREYIDSATPVSSQMLQRKHDFGICPASIRIEMQQLADKGFINQPHTSAGRVPTDKGYRLFVDNLLNPSFMSLAGEETAVSSSLIAMARVINDTFKLFQALTKKMALESHALVLLYLKDEDIFLKEGWEQVLMEPEFKEQECILDFAGLLENMEKNINDIDNCPGVEVYIGKENPFSRAKEFSVIVSKYDLPKGEEGIISILGPKRMAYDRNIEIINLTTKLLAEI